MKKYTLPLLTLFIWAIYLTISINVFKEMVENKGVSWFFFIILPQLWWFFIGPIMIGLWIIALLKAAFNVETNVWAKSIYNLITWVLFSISLLFIPFIVLYAKEPLWPFSYTCIVIALIYFQRTIKKFLTEKEKH